MKQLDGIIIEGTIYMNDGVHVLSEFVKANDYSLIRKMIKAADTLNLEIDFKSDGYGDWEDKHGDVIFENDILLQLKGKKWYADLSANGKIEQLIPNPSAEVELKFFRKR